MERMYSANPHFVRCIKPNGQKEPGVLDNQVVLLQVSKNSVLYKTSATSHWEGRFHQKAVQGDSLESPLTRERVATFYICVKILSTWLFLWHKLLGPDFAILDLSHFFSMNAMRSACQVLGFIFTSPLGWDWYRQYSGKIASQRRLFSPLSQGNSEQKPRGDCFDRTWNALIWLYLDILSGLRSRCFKG